MYIVQSASPKNLAVTKRTLILNRDLANLNRLKNIETLGLIQYKLGLYVFEEKKKIVFLTFYIK